MIRPHYSRYECSNLIVVQNEMEKKHRLKHSRDFAFQTSLHFRVLKNQEQNERSRNGTAETIMSGMPLADLIRDPRKTLERLVGRKVIDPPKMH